MKLLKLSFTLVLGVFLMGSVSAQEYKSTDKLPKTKMVGDVQSPTSDMDAKNKAFYEGWKFPASAVSSVGGTWESYVGFLFEDSIVQFVSNQSTFYQNWHAVGGVFDPTDVNYELDGDGIKFSRFNEYTVDSLYFPYLYVRYVDSVDLGAGNVEVVDTLIVRFFDYEELTFWNYTRDGQTNRFAQPTNFTQSLLGSDVSTYEVKIPLTKSDSTPVTETGWGSKPMFLDLNELIPADPTLATPKPNVCGFSIAYKTMVPFEHGDTMIARDGIEPTKRLNYFGYSYYTNVGTHVPQTDYYNNSFWTNSEMLYGEEFSGLTGYIPSSLWQNPLYLSYQMKVSTGNLNVTDLNDNMKVALYPNPVSRTEMLKLDFTLVNADNVNIDLYDLLGNKVKSVANGHYASGEHQIDLNITDLAPGVYLYSVQAGNVKTAKKITITE